MKAFSSLLVLVPLLAASSVSAHGYLNEMTIAGKSYRGNIPGKGNPSASVIRQIKSQDPNYGASNPALTCGPSAKPASLVADANPGDKVTFKWTGGDGRSNWPHDTGPMLTYMASCGSVSCDKFDASKAKWFKIGEEGYASGSTWKQASLRNGGVGHATIPATLAPGNYLIRHEIIALHLAQTARMAEYYPNCAQLRVGGSQKGAPSANELVSFPGGYKDEDRGIHVDVYGLNPSKYVMPGPAISKLAATGGNVSPNTPSNDTPSSSSAKPAATSVAASKPVSSSASSKPAATSVAASKPASSSAAANPSTGTKGGKQCKKKRDVAAEEETVVVRPRHVSHVMRRMDFGGSRH
ncbi:hypothetical protein D9613_010338 [Agrocybe pediades]|uniref:lytic cellulose monooxygenase (C4-dehydrogenating) n=1 Tax=Agrocybe pediades TaxID=84607 RepID=A0A8H4QFM8_9AGAR|nr:hypothetical protein D9613_010338 [Agrocybe pediades]